MYCPGGRSAERGPLVVTGTAAGTSAAAAAGGRALPALRRGPDRRCWSRGRAGSSRSCEAGDLEGAKAGVRRGARPVRADRAGGRELRRPRPGDRRPRGRRPRGEVDGLPPDRAEPLGARRDRPGAAAGRSCWTDVLDLQRRVQTIELEPAQVANGSVELLGEVSKSKITGEEERYSHIDLVDFEANVEGAKAAFDSVRDLVEAKRPALAKEIDGRFADVDAALEPYRTRHRLRRLHGADEGRHARPEPVDRRARRAALPGGGDRRGAMSRAAHTGAAAGGRRGRRRRRARRRRRRAARRAAATATPPSPFPFHGDHQAGHRDAGAGPPALRRVRRRHRDRRPSCAT